MKRIFFISTLLLLSFGVYSASLLTISPSSAKQGQTLTVTITGANTHFNQASSSISFTQASSGTTIYASTFHMITDTSIQAYFTLPLNAAVGNYTVNLNNPADGNLTLNNGFLITADSTKRLVSISQATAIQGQTLSVIITGLNTHFNQTSSSISFSQASSSTVINSGSITKINDTSISASFTIPANASIGNYDVNLSNSLDGNLSITNGFQVKLFAALTSVSPSSAKQGQTLAVTITGVNTHFSQTSSTISFSQASGTTINSDMPTRINDTSIQANFTLPINAAVGNYTVNLNNPVDGNLTLNNGFLITADSTKRLVSVSQATAMQGQALSVTITGVNTHFNQASSSISFSQASSSTIINSGTITKINDTSINASFTIPANASSGNYNVNLSNSLDGSLSLLNGFQVIPKIGLVSVSQATAKPGQTLAVTITGLNTHFNQASSSISFSQASSSTTINSGTITKINDTSISASFTIPANASSGNYNVNLSNYLDGNLTLNNGFFISSDSIKKLVSVAPATAKPGQTLAVTITGLNTHFNQASSSISFSQASSSTTINSGTITKINDTSISASFTIPANASLGNYDVNLSNSLDGNLSIPNGFQVKLVAALASVTPSSAKQGQTLSVTITGVNTHFNQASSTISFSQASGTTINANTFHMITDTSIQANFTLPINATVGNYTVNLNNSIDGNLTLNNGFLITADSTKRLVSVSQPTAKPGQTLAVTITGVNTHFNQASSSISFSQASSSTTINSGTITKINDTSINASFTIPANAPLGNYDVNLSNSLDGNLSIPNGFQVKLVAALASVTPSSAKQGQTLAVTITGVNTHFNQASSTISFSQASGTTINANTFHMITDTSIQANFTLPLNAAVGNYTVNLNNSIDGNLTLNNGFLITADSTKRLVSVSQPTAMQGQTLAVTITGVNTHFNQASSSISFSQASSSTIINSGTITKINDTSINASFTIPANAPSGNYNVNLSNSLDGSLSLLNGFQVIPQIGLVSISQLTTQPGQTLDVTITGANTHFNQASSCTISFSQASSSTIINSSIITKINDTLIKASFKIPADASLGYYNVNVSNSLDGNLTLNNGFLINSDSIKRLVSVSPATAMQGQTLAVTITGINTHFNQASSSISFSQGSSTIINSDTITKISDTSISASFAIPLNASLGNYDVNLTNSLDGNILIANGFKVTPKIALVSVSPAVASQGQKLTVTITGLNTHFNQASSTGLYQTSSGTSINSDSIIKISDTSLQVQFIIPINAPVGKYDLHYEDPYDGEYLKLTDGFQINANPTIRLVSISQITTQPGQTLEVTITGANTHFNQASSCTISFSQASSSTIINSSIITKINDTSIKASFKIPADASLGYYNVNVSNSLDGNLLIPKGFKIAWIATDVSEKSMSLTTVYPNPATDFLHLSGVKGLGLLTISDLNGRTWLKKQVIDNEVISVSTLQNGLYILNLVTIDDIKTLKIVKK
jgi:hypothetical protein